MSNNDISIEKCAVCGEANPKRFSVYFKSYLVLHRCGRCGFVFQSPDALGKYPVNTYGDYYDLDFLKKGQEFLYPERQRSFSDIARRVKYAAGAGTELLDVGSGDGQFSLTCERAGFNVTAVEPSNALSAYAQTKIKGNVITAEYGKNLFDKNSFDAVTFIQVLEHLPRPADFLEAAFNHLKPGGVVAIEVPSIWSPHFLVYRLTGLKWFVRPPTGVIFSHIGYFSPITLRRLAGQAGFKEISLTTGRWRYKYSGWLRLAGYLLDPILNFFRLGGILYLGKKS